MQHILLCSQGICSLLLPIVTQLRICRNLQCELSHFHNYLDTHNCQTTSYLVAYAQSRAKTPTGPAYRMYHSSNKISVRQQVCYLAYYRCTNPVQQHQARIWTNLFGWLVLTYICYIPSTGFNLALVKNTNGALGSN